jgi:hypothetical protein
MPKTPDLLYDAQHTLLEITEELGATIAHLREALSDFNNGNLTGAEIVADDALLTLSNIERQSSEAAALVSRWINAE